MKRTLLSIMTIILVICSLNSFVYADKVGIDLPIDSFPSNDDSTDSGDDGVINDGGVSNDEGNTPENNTPSFTDVASNSWYKQYVDYAVSNKIFAGTSKTTFSPLSKLTRAQFIQVIANLEGVTLDNNTKTSFADVPSGKWYTGAVAWGSKNSIVSGTGDGNFSPERQVTREEMCVMLINYAEKYKKLKLSQDGDDYVFADHDAISSWATLAVYKCRDNDIISGTGNNLFSPKATADRAQGATIFTKFHKNYN